MTPSAAQALFAATGGESLESGVDIAPTYRRPRRPSGAIKALVSFAALGLALTGCYRLDSAVVVNDDGSGTVELIVALDTSVLAGLSDMAPDPSQIPSREEVCAQFLAAMQAQGDAADAAAAVVSRSTSAYEDGQHCGVKISAEIVASADPGAAFASAIQGDPETPIGDFTVAKGQDGEWAFAYAGFQDVVAQGTAAIAAESGAAELAGLGPLLAGQAVIRYSLSLPGSAVPMANNATTVSNAAGRTMFVWQLDAERLPERIEARTVPEEPVEASDSSAEPEPASEAPSPDEVPESLAAIDDDNGNGPLLVAIAALLATLVIGGSVMISRSKAETRPSA